MKRLITIPILHWFSSWSYQMLLMFFVFISCPLSGQERQKTTVDTSEYNQWHRIEKGNLSSNGKWIHYRIVHPGADTLFVQNTAGTQKYTVPNGFNPHFSASNSFFACQDKDSTLHLIDLDKKEVKKIQSVLTFEYSKNTLIVIKNQKNQWQVQLRKALNDISFTIDGAKNFLISPEGDLLAVIRTVRCSSEIVLIDLNKNTQKKCIIPLSKGIFSKLKWASDGKSIAFQQIKDDTTQLYSYALQTEVLSAIATEASDQILHGYHIDKYTPLVLDKEGQKVFFYVRENTKTTQQKPSSDVQVWNAKDKWIYTGEEIIKGWHLTPKIVMWEIKTNRLSFITNLDLPVGFPTENSKHSISYNPQKYEPQPKLEADLDLYHTKLLQGKTKLFLEKQPGETPLFSSPNGTYVLYFRNKNWFTYNLDKEQYQNLTASHNNSFAAEEQGTAGHITSYGSPGWTAKEEHILLYDQFDIWKVKADGSSAVNMTQGRASQKRYRIIPQSMSQTPKFKFNHLTANSFDLKDGLLLQSNTLDGTKEGIYWLSSKGRLIEITWVNKQLSGIEKATDSNCFAWVEESYHAPPQLMFKKEGAPIIVLVETNKQHNKSYNHPVEIINYKSRESNDVTGLLYYPVGYNPEKKYPMIVKVYEKQTQDLHLFSAPSLYNSVGFNIANFTGSGYFVLLPDIMYTVGNVGESALVCVENAVRSAVQNKGIDQSKIGLIGHSFGGYQTNYILTKSKWFACAVAGAATSNFISSYLSESKNNKQPNYFKIENAQARMGKSLYEDKEAYLINSPIWFADQITTPLLSWTGLEDRQVDYNQSFELYMAMRRLGKEHVLLAFPEEEHAISDPARDKDLTIKIQQWFDTYLKLRHKEPWMIPH